MLKRRHFLLVGVLAAAMAAVPALLAHDGEVVLDDKNWALAMLNELDGTMEVLTDGDAHPPIYQINVLRPGEGMEDLHLEKPVPSDILQPQEPLSLRFRARSACPRTMRATLQNQDADTWATEVKLTGDWKEFKLPVKPTPQGGGPTVLAFQIGGTSGEIAITDIRLVRS